MKALHIFKSGCHVAMSGERMCFSLGDIERIARIYDAGTHRAPLVLGHPHTDSPAHGWVSGLKAVGEDLFAFVEQISEELQGWVKTGRYGAISASFYPPEDRRNPRAGDWYLRHVGFLGAAAPSVKGLTRPSFTDGCACAVVNIDSAFGRDFAVPLGFAVDPNGLDLHLRAQGCLERYPGMTYIQAVKLAVVRAGAERDWERSAALRVEFTERNTYAAFCEAEALGRVSG